MPSEEAEHPFCESSRRRACCCFFFVVNWIHINRLVDEAPWARVRHRTQSALCPCTVCQSLRTSVTFVPGCLALELAGSIKKAHRNGSGGLSISFIKRRKHFEEAHHEPSGRQNCVQTSRQSDFRASDLQAPSYAIDGHRVLLPNYDIMKISHNAAGCQLKTSTSVTRKSAHPGVLRTPRTNTITCYKKRSSWYVTDSN